MSHTYRFNGEDITSSGHHSHKKIHYRKHVHHEKPKRLFLPPLFAQELLIELFQQNSRCFIKEGLYKNKYSTEKSTDHFLTLVKGETHFERNCSYLAAHLSHRHSLSRTHDQYYIEKSGLFYFADKRPYIEKINAPREISCHIVRTFLDLPVLDGRTKAYETPHLFSVGMNSQSYVEEIKEFTHKVSFIKDFTGLDLTNLRCLKESTNFIPPKFVPLQGIGLANPHKQKGIPATSLMDLQPTTQVQMIAQMTTEFHEALAYQIFHQVFSVKDLPWEGNVFVLTLFPVIKDLSYPLSYH